jgi:hypothetical protein
VRILYIYQNARWNNEKNYKNKKPLKALREELTDFSPVPVL